MKKSNGFTIVELLIVVVIIGILAAIVVVAYNGITQQARTAKTLSAINGWAKAIKLYHAENGSWPSANSCLGTTSTYTSNPYCWDGTSWDVDTTFLNQIATVTSSQPEPDITQISTANPQRRGAFYYIPSGDHVIRAMFAGESSCPSTGVGPLVSSSANDLGMWCQYSLE